MYKGKLFTCIQLGKKFFWDNGVNVKSQSRPTKGLPATCTIQDGSWRSLRESFELSGGTINFSASISNSSTTNTASQIKVFIEWFDEIGISYKKTLRIPRLYPGQTLEFGDSDFFRDSSKNFPKEPVDVKLRSSCVSTPFNSKELVNGKIPTISGEAPITFEEYPEDGAVSVNASYILKNSLGKEISLAGERKSDIADAYIFGIIQDRFGNLLAGYSGFVVGDNLQVLEPGDTARIDDNLFETSFPLNEYFKRMAIFKYTIITD